MGNVKNWRNIDTGEKFEAKNRYLRNCPKCKKELMSNRYKDLYVSGGDDFEKDEIYQDESIDIAMEYCRKCGELYIRIEY